MNSYEAFSYGFKLGAILLTKIFTEADDLCRRYYLLNLNPLEPVTNLKNEIFTHQPWTPSLNTI